MTKRLRRILAFVLAGAMLLMQTEVLDQLTITASAAKETEETEYVQQYAKEYQTVVRAAVEEITELPQYGKPYWMNMERGCAGRPFTVLEIVPYEEYAEFGYLIGGCEPVDIDRLAATPEIRITENWGVADVTDTYNPATMQMEYVYTSKELFLRNVLQLEEEQVAGYCAVVKTITPKELNAAPQWVKYADLIYIADDPRDRTRSDLWERYNKAGKSPSPDRSEKGFAATEDLSYYVVMEILNKNTQEDNFAALVFSNFISDPGRLQSLYGEAAQRVEYPLLDYNFQQVSPVGETGFTFQGFGVKNNLYKLFLMTASVNPLITKQVFGEYFYKDSEGKAGVSFLDGDAAVYWGEHIFHQVKKEDFKNYFKTSGSWLYADDYFRKNAEKLLDVYGYYGINLFPEMKACVHDRVYICTTDNTFSMAFGGMEVSVPGSPYVTPGPADDWTDFNAIQKSTHSDALRYILELDDDVRKTAGYDQELRILDIEPSVGLNSDYTPDWKVKDSYFRMMLSDWTGKIKVDHMTMNAFVGCDTDLNSTYDMIYLGADVSGFWQNGDGSPAFRDSRMNGWAYFHIGDLAKSGYSEVYGTARTANFIPYVTDNTLRFAGNDITHQKADELLKFLEAGHLLVADDRLMEYGAMDPDSNLCRCLQNMKQKQSPCFDTFSVDKVRLFRWLMMQNTVVNPLEVSFYEVPAEYNEQNYLPAKDGCAQLRFDFEVTDPESVYYIYVDSDRDGRFSPEEIIKSGNAKLHNEITCNLSKEVAGAVFWRIEVCSRNNEQRRVSREGCSAVKYVEKADNYRRVINVLQITPDNGSEITVDLTSSAYSSLYSGLDAFDIEVDRINWSQFENYFRQSRSEKFTFDMSREVTVDYPDWDTLFDVESVDGWNGKKAVGDGKDLDRYNVIVVGGADRNGLQDFSNRYGAVEYLNYFALSGRTVIFLHDVTSIYNGPYNAGAAADDVRLPQGYTANAMLRDLMGINRYKIISNELNGFYFRQGLADELISYQVKCIREGRLYDTTSAEQKQGFTLNAMRKMCEYGMGEYRFPYRYMVEDAATGNLAGKGTGFDGDDCVTGLAVRLNAGQVTSYPYNISELLPIANTHSQYYQLNLDDPEVKVWYTLETPESYGKQNMPSSKVYAASPQDAANNYYLYNRGNIWSISTGHANSADYGYEMERKLLVNMLVTAYRNREEIGEPVYPEADDRDYLSFTAENGWVDVSLNSVGMPGDLHLQYSRDKVLWKDVYPNDIYNSMFTMDDGETYYIRAAEKQSTFGVNTQETDFYGVPSHWEFSFEGTGKVKAGGSVMSLLDPDCENVEMGEYAFYRLFAGCNALISAPNLPATSLSAYCYSEMFYYCENLTEAPQLSATGLAVSCYKGMFKGCAKLEKAPQLPATSLAPYCYRSMFYGCNSLTAVEADFTDYSAEYCIDDWLYGIQTEGILSAPVELWNKTDLGLPKSWKIICEGHFADENCWISDEISHWHGCITEGCTEHRFDAAEHEIDRLSANDDDNGKTHTGVCEVCGQTMTQRHNLVNNICTICGTDMTGRCGSGLTYEVERTYYGTYTLKISGTGRMYDYSEDFRPWMNESAVITEIEIGNGVTMIGSNAFMGFTALEEIVIPGNIKKIGSVAFQGCTKLKKVVLDEGVQIISPYAFMGDDQIAELSLPESLEEIGEAAFAVAGSYNTQLRSLSLPENLKEIGVIAFMNCSGLEELFIPGKPEKIGKNAFQGCTGLQRIYVGCQFTENDRKELGTTGGIMLSDVMVAESHDFSNFEKCTVCGAYRDSVGANLAGYSLSLYDNIGVNFYMELAESVTKDENAKFVMQLPDGNSKEVPVSDAEQVEVDGNAYYVFDCRVAAKEMTDVIRAHMVLGDGTEGTKYEFTVQDYAQYILDHSSEFESAVPVVKALLNYGASAQEYFGYNINSLANAILSDIDKQVSAEPDLEAYNYASPAATDKISYLGTSLSLESEVEIKCYFEASTDLTNADVSVKCETAAVDASRIKIGKEGNVQYIAVNGVSPAEYGQKYTIKVQDLSVDNVSVYGYIAKAFASNGESKELTEVLKNLYTYGEEAAEYAR